MAEVTVKVVGKAGATDENASTIGELKSSLGLPSYSASVNRNPQDDSFELSDGDFVTLAASVKGGK